MTHTGKSREGDPHELRRETAKPVERAAALSRLVSDQRREFEPDIATLLTHREPILRAESVLALVGRWRIGRYIGDARRLLAADPDWLVRRNAAHAISLYVQRGQVTASERKLMLGLLTRTVQSDDDAGVQEAAYEGMLRILDRPSAEFFHENRDFDVRRDVNWELLAPYLAEAADETA